MNDSMKMLRTPSGSATAMYLQLQAQNFCHLHLLTYLTLDKLQCMNSSIENIDKLTCHLGS